MAMKKIKVRLKERSYDILIGSGCLNSLGRALGRLDIGRDAFIITNAKIKSLYGRQINRALRKTCSSVRYQVIPDSERAKSVSVCLKILNKIAGHDKKKRIFVVAIGGGVAGDLAGFIASVYRRGIPYVQIPTTLLAQVDSAIGGKVAIDLAVGKNLVGSFYQPRLVVSDVSLLKSLPLFEIKNGLAEIIKYGVIKDVRLFAFIEKHYRDILRLEKSALNYVIYKCSKIKAGIVEIDERDSKDKRIILNCGHTIAHAIETASSYKNYTHGEAVAIGMLAEGSLSCKLGLLRPAALSRLENLLEGIGLPTRLSGVSIGRVIEAQEHDKKIIRQVNRFVLPTRIGSVKICENIPVSLIKSVIRERMR